MISLDTDSSNGLLPLNIIAEIHVMTTRIRYKKMSEFQDVTYEIEEAGLKNGMYNNTFVDLLKQILNLNKNSPPTPPHPPTQPPGE